MATFAALDFRVEVNAVNMSAMFTSATLPLQYDALEDTAFGDVARSRVAGLGDSTFTGNLNQDFAASATDILLYTAYATRGPVTVKVRPTSGTITTTNPEYVGSYLPNQHTPFGNKVGELATTQVSWPLSNPTGIVRNTT